MKKLLLLSAFILFSSSWTMAQSSQEPPSGMSEIQAYSIFYENYKNDSYGEALQFGRWIWKAMPESIEDYPKFDLKKNLRRLITVYSELSGSTEDPSLAEAYADTALTIFDNISEKYGDELNTYDWAVRKGRFYESNSDHIDDASSKAAAEYKKAFDEKPEEFTNMNDGYYVQSMLRNLISQEKKDEALAIIEEAEPYAPEKLEEYFNSARNELFDSPDERIAFLEGELEDDPENEELLNQLQNIYEDEDMVSELNEVNKKLYEIDPNYENSMALGESAQSDANYSEAIEYFKEALDKTDKSDQKAAIALNISNAYMNNEELESAREYARTAADHDSEWGRPYINMADAYAQSVNQCTDDRKMEEEDRVVYWLVLDYLDKAKSVDSSVSNEVDNKYESYAPVTPSTEQQFFKDWEDGQEINVDSSLNECYGWINETTTVRR